MHKLSSLLAVSVFLMSSSFFGSLQARETYPEGDSPYERERARRFEEGTYHEDRPLPRPCKEKKADCDRPNRPHYEWTYKGEGGEWRIHGDWLYQTPIHAKKTLVADDTTGEELLGLKHFGFKHASGYRAHLSYQEPKCNSDFTWIIDLGIMANQWKKTKEVVGAGNLDAVTDSVDYFLANAITVDYSSDLKNYEANFMLQFDRYLCGFIGASAITLDEKFNMQSTVITTSNYDIKVKNRLYGMQAGFILGFCIYDNLYFNFLAKGGIYWNDAAKKLDFRDDDNALVTSYRKNKGEAAYAAEGIATVIYRPVKYFSIDGGYMIDWYSRVALAGKQFRNTVDDIDVKRKIHFHGHFVHGFVAGATFYF